VDRSPWWRTGAGVAAWLALAVTTTAVAWTAVGVVADQGDGPVPVAVPAAAGTPRSTAAAEAGESSPPTESTPSEPSPSSPSTSSSDDPPSPQGASPRVLSSPAGAVSVACTGQRHIRLIYATSADSWQETVDKAGPDEVEVEFVRGDDEEFRTRARCEGGVIEGETEER